MRNYITENYEEIREMLLNVKRNMSYEEAMNLLNLLRIKSSQGYHSPAKAGVTHLMDTLQLIEDEGNISNGLRKELSHNLTSAIRGLTKTLSGGI
jgi:hypothetical protein